MLDYARDEEITQEAYASGLLLDPKRRSFIDNLGHEHLRGKDKRLRRAFLFHAVKGLCTDCGRYRDEEHGDMDHLGKTPRTRCECWLKRLNNGKVCTGIAWRCTMDPSRGGSPQSCHGRRHGRLIGGRHAKAH